MISIGFGAVDYFFKILVFFTNGLDSIETWINFLNRVKILDL